MLKEKLCKKCGLTEDQFYGREKIEGSLDLRGLTSIPEGFNPTVGGYLYLSGRSKHIGAHVNDLKVNKNYFWDKNDKRYAIIDGIFCEVLGERNHQSEGKAYIIYSAKKVNRENTSL